MGLDLVEIVLQTEETFNLDLPDDECEQIRTVGDLYRLVLSKLQLPYVPGSDIETAGSGRSRSQLGSSSDSWSPPDVWLTVKAIVVEQQQVDEEDVKEEARFLDDLRCD